MRKLFKIVLRTFVAFVVLIVGFVIWALIEGEDAPISRAPVVPDWTAIAAWPEVTSDRTEAMPDPNRQITAIVLDDSGSMGPDIVPAKAAVESALDAMAPSDRVAVVAINRGVILPFMTVADANIELPRALARVDSDGSSTPLTGAVRIARELLEAEAAVARAFGTYRIIVTTDGAADDGDALTAEIEEIARITPIQIATIGIGITGNHVLRRSGLGSFVDVSGADQLAEALKKAVAESQSFDAITAFEEG